MIPICLTLSGASHADPKGVNPGAGKFAVPAPTGLFLSGSTFGSDNVPHCNDFYRTSGSGNRRDSTPLRLWGNEFMKAPKKRAGLF